METTNKPKTVLQIVANYLTAEGYDGLASEDGECGCLISDLAPCSQMGEDCKPGHSRPCNCGQGCDFHIVSEGD